MSCLSLSSRRKQRSSFFRIDCDKVEFRRNEDWIFSTPGPWLPLFFESGKNRCQPNGHEESHKHANANSFTHADCST